MSINIEYRTSPIDVKRLDSLLFTLNHSRRGRERWLTPAGGKQTTEGLPVRGGKTYHGGIHDSDLCVSLQWRHNGRDGVSHHQPLDCVLNRLFRRRSKKTSELRVTGLCEVKSPLPCGKISLGTVRSLLCANVLMGYCRVICWYRCACLLALTLRRESKTLKCVPANVTCSEFVPLNLMSHVHVHVLRVAKPLYYSCYLLTRTSIAAKCDMESTPRAKQKWKITNVCFN